MLIIPDCGIPLLEGYGIWLYQILIIIWKEEGALQCFLLEILYFLMMLFNHYTNSVHKMKLYCQNINEYWFHFTARTLFLLMLLGI